MVLSTQVRPGFGVAGSMRVTCVEVSGFYFSEDGDAGFSLHMGENLQIIAKPRRALRRCGSDPRGWKDLDFRFLRSW